VLVIIGLKLDDLLCSVAHSHVTENSAKLTSSPKSIGADQQDVSITYTYSIAFIVRSFAYVFTC